MGIVRRIIEPGVVVTLHPGPPTSSQVVLGRSRLLVPGVFAEVAGGRKVVNRAVVECEISASGAARYVGIWVEGVLEGSGQLRFRRDVEPGVRTSFPRGALEIWR